MSELRIEVVDDELCPVCGGPGSPKVGNADGTWSWKCLTPSCRLGFWVPGTDFREWRLDPEAEAEMHDRIKAEVDAMMVGRKFVRLDDGSVPGVEQWGLAPE
jgi:hypothetical protein